jgi:hypothetical protein
MPARPAVENFEQKGFMVMPTPLSDILVKTTGSWLERLNRST